MEPVHELERQGDQQGQAKESKGADRKRRLAHRVHVGDQAVEAVAEPGDQHEQEDDYSARVDTMIKLRTCDRPACSLRQVRWGGDCVGHDGLGT